MKYGFLVAGNLVFAFAIFLLSWAMEEIGQPIYSDMLTNGSEQPLTAQFFTLMFQSWLTGFVLAVLSGSLFVSGSLLLVAHSITRCHRINSEAVCKDGDE